MTSAGGSTQLSVHEIPRLSSRAADTLGLAREQPTALLTFGAELSLFEGCRDRLGPAGLRVLAADPAPSADAYRPLHINTFCKMLLRLVGSEVESREIQLGVVVGPQPTDSLGLLRTEEVELSADERERLKDPKEAAQLYRERLIGRADGSVGDSVVVIHPGAAQIYGLYSLRRSETTHPASSDAHFLQLTRDPGYTAVWLKPLSTARVYRAGALQAQVIRLRDGLGWAIRVPEQITADVETIVTRKTGVAMGQAVASRLVEVALELSESRVGGAFYIVPDRATFEAMVLARDAVLGGRYGGRSTRRLGGTVVVSSFRPEAPGSNVAAQPRERLLKLLSQDGALILTSAGELLASKTYFMGPGGRRHTAAAVCCGPRNRIAALIVSQDGPMYLAGHERSGGPDALSEVDSERYI